MQLFLMTSLLVNCFLLLDSAAVDLKDNLILKTSKSEIRTAFKDLLTEVRGLKTQLSFLSRRSKLLHSLVAGKHKDHDDGDVCVSMKAKGETQCPDSFQSYRRGSCYRIETDRVTWRQARDRCSQWGSHLLQVETSGEQKFLEQEFAKNKATHSCDYWTGATDVQTEGQWLWNTTGRPLANGYAHWHMNEPNNGGGQENCMWLDWYYRWAWNDATCQGSRACFICETDRQ